MGLLILEFDKGFALERDHEDPHGHQAVYNAQGKDDFRIVNEVETQQREHLQGMHAYEVCHPRIAVLQAPAQEGNAVIA
ncbi:MAG TPA: hypothetical protein DCE41_17070, partial [Cytophagales bacterium]|nr:hypothetical protein [Cytophagales bacterium]